jgi:CheY-like chemotaxis protein
VLVVDDEEGVRHFVGAVLERAGYETVVAADGPHALQAAQDGRPVDLLLTDLMMPAMRGDELARQLRAGDPRLKVLYFTGFRDLLFTDRPSLWQDEAFLDKPCTVSGLLEAVAHICNGTDASGPLTH